MKIPCVFALVSVVLCVLSASPVYAQPVPIAMNTQDWVFSSPDSRIENGELVLDGRAAVTKAFFKPLQWVDLTLTAWFMVDPQPQGVLACGFVFRAKDAADYYYVHFDRNQAILCRSDGKESWNEISRVGGLDKPAGQWHEAQVQCDGDIIRVYLNGALLYEAKDSTLSAGRIGFYASQGLVHVKDITVSGAAAPAATDLVLPPPPLPMFKHLCTDAGAGGYEAFPDVCRLSDGRLMCAFYAGYGHVALPNDRLPLGGRISYCTSSDEGRTWTAAQTLYDGPDDDRDPSISQLASGRITCVFFSLRKKDGGEPPWTGLGTWIVHSDDKGETWSEPSQVATDYYCSSPVRQLRDGRLVLGLYAERGDTALGAVTFSEDDGLTWSAPVDIDNGGVRLDAETDVIELSDGTLFAALRGDGEVQMAWSSSDDGGRTWSVAEPFGFKGHCPYLHRAVNGIVLLAHRIPNTSLHYSLDECRTWSANVVVDDVHGAYPSMVNLKDGSVLIVYYEEGEGSSIRAKRFLPTQSGIQWLPVDRGKLPTATVVEQKRIWDAAPHNAFTNLIRYKDEWFCVFREGEGHVSADGSLRVIVSKDGARWESAALITSDTDDLRDAQICITPDNRLMLTGAAVAMPRPTGRLQTFAYFSEDGRHWTEGVPIGDEGLWLWRVTWNNDTAYSFGYATKEQREERYLRLYKSADGSDFQALFPALRENEYANESAMVFLADGTCLCLLRRDNADPANANGLLGESKPPYTEWTWKDVGARIGGPCMVQLPDGRLVAAVRLHDDHVRTSLCSIDRAAGALTELVGLPSGGDTSYPGMVWHDGLLWVSYYSSHEGRTMIYLAKVRLD